MRLDSGPEDAKENERGKEEEAGERGTFSSLLSLRLPSLFLTPVASQFSFAPLIRALSNIWTPGIGYKELHWGEKYHKQH